MSQKLVLNGKPTATIIAPENGAPAYAAQVIQRYVERMSGAKLPIITDCQRVAGTRIIIRVRENAAKIDGFRIHSSADELVIESAVPRGCIYGAYALLEEIGCRFYDTEPLGIIVPECPDVAVRQDLDILREPSFAIRFASKGGPEDHVQWGFNFTRGTDSPEQEQLVRQLDLKQTRWGHIWPALVQKQFFPDGREPQPMDYAGRQDWLPADEKGARRNNGQTLCFSNSEAMKWFTDNAANWVLARCRNADYMSMWSADKWRTALCRCEKCQASGLNATDWYLLVHNDIWRRLKERGWKGIFGWIAYHGSEAPPEKAELMENGREMDMLYAPRPRKASKYGPFPNDHLINRFYRENLSAWSKYLALQNYRGIRTVLEYYYDLLLLGRYTEGRAWLIPTHRNMQAEMRFYFEQGFDGFSNCDPPASCVFPDPLNKWLYYRLLWDVNLDVGAARHDFFTHYYGPAGEAMEQARKDVERLMHEPPSLAGVERLRALAGSVETMPGRVGNDEVLQKRIRAMSLWVKYCSLCKESEYHVETTEVSDLGQAAELAIRQLLTDNKEFLIGNNFITEDDLNIVATNVVNYHIGLHDAMRRLWDKMV